ncbi:hypothetical protein SAMN05660666_03886 [Novosphingobium aromaticivorans]|nr:hypothetical protein [Novosphingobium aromaticivorans]SCY95902.1 hypothetical protein SAMN05660666_03886 [Novosphingobium aromaticivorans]
MKLKVLEQIHVSAVSSDTLRRGQEIEVSNAAGEDLLKFHPDKFEQVAGKCGGAKKAAVPENKQAPKPDNKFGA